MAAVNRVDHGGVEVIRRAIKHDLTVRHADNPWTEPACNIERMQIDQNRNIALSINGGQRLHHRLSIGWIERGNRLVRQNDFRQLHQGPRDGDTLLLPTGQSNAALQSRIGHAQGVQFQNRACAFFGREEFKHWGHTPLAGEAAN